MCEIICSFVFHCCPVCVFFKLGLLCDFFGLCSLLFSQLKIVTGWVLVASMDGGAVCFLVCVGE